MAGRPPKEKSFSNMLKIALSEAAEDRSGKSTTKLRLIADKLVEKALEGDFPSIKEIADRTDGKAVQGVELGGPEGEDGIPQAIRFVIIDPKKE